MGWFGPQTGAADGGKDFDSQCLHTGFLKTGSHHDAENKRRKQNAKKAERAAKRDEKARTKKGFWS